MSVKVATVAVSEVQQVEVKEIQLPTLEDYKLPPLGHALSGAVGSALANVIVYPLDLTTTRLQVSKEKHADSGDKSPTLLSTLQHIYHNEGGLRALYAGLPSDTLATVLSSFLYHYCYTFLRNVQERRNVRLGKAPELGLVQQLLLGAEAGIISRFFTTPVGNVTTRKQAVRSGEHSTTMAILNDIWDEKGITGFWTGYRASIVLTSNPSLTYFFFEYLKAAVLRMTKQARLTSFQVFFLSAISKSMATALTYPFIFLKTNMIVGNKTNAKGKDKEAERNESMLALWRRIVKQEGVSGLYKGIQSQITKGFFNHGIMYMIKDRVSLWLTVVFFAAYKARLRRRLARQNPQNLEKALAGLKQEVKEGAWVNGHICDVSKEDAVQRFCKSLDTPVSTLVNAAGISQSGLFTQLRTPELTRILNVNLMGTIWMTQGLIRSMIRQKQGCIINLSSVVGTRGNVGQAAYAASKASVVGLTLSLAKELGPRGIRVNAIAPGFIDTDMTKDILSEEKRSEYVQRIGLGRFGRPEDIAHGCVYLAQASYITGQVLTIDGGLIL
ncbi:hypothetical protein BZG36_02957 [Bifiguratus adelaidae]|uniref:Uncharacterized protein n=1 Tax=Bifiguratus adelaidae TaxID=1938954 RepID=A0A261Y0U7_9FUNG|nr:hypothetical protein BZG36_02957 [Bifiguratus adelaidae]